MALADALLENSALAEIYLLGNKVSFEGLNYLAKSVVKENKLSKQAVNKRQISPIKEENTGLPSRIRPLHHHYIIYKNSFH